MQFCPGTYHIKIFPLDYCLHVFACSILMNFSSSRSNPNPYWSCSINLSRRPLASFRPGQPTQKCSSSSTMPELHVLHVLSSTGRQMYLPVSICNGAVPPLRWASRDLYAFTLVLCMYSLVCFEFNVWSQPWFTCNVGFPILPLQAGETADNYMFCLSMQESITSSGTTKSAAHN